MLQSGQVNPATGLPDFFSQAGLAGLSAAAPNMGSPAGLPQGLNMGICKFFSQTGMCARGESCPFLHVFGGQNPAAGSLPAGMMGGVAAMDQAIRGLPGAGAGLGFMDFGPTGRQGFGGGAAAAASASPALRHSASFGSNRAGGLPVGPGRKKDGTNGFPASATLGSMSMNNSAMAAAVAGLSGLQLGPGGAGGRGGGAGSGGRTTR